MCVTIEAACMSVTTSVTGAQGSQKRALDSREPEGKWLYVSCRCWELKLASLECNQHS